MKKINAFAHTYVTNHHVANIWDDRHMHFTRASQHVRHRKCVTGKRDIQTPIYGHSGTDPLTRSLTRGLTDLHAHTYARTHTFPAFGGLPTLSHSDMRAGEGFASFGGFPEAVLKKKKMPVRHGGSSSWLIEVHPAIHRHLHRKRRDWINYMARRRRGQPDNAQ